MMRLQTVNLHGVLIILIPVLTVVFKTFAWLLWHLHGNLTYIHSLEKTNCTFAQ